MTKSIKEARPELDTLWKAQEDGLKKLALWNKVQETDPKYTKNFNKSGGFRGTSINPTYNNKKATEIFGLCGIGWGVNIIEESYREGAPLDKCKEIVHVLRINFWYIYDGEMGIIPSFGQTTFVGSNKNGIFTDEEAPKKSLTDAITKAMSMLGFSADVFLGLYDDVKYINDMKEQFSGKDVKPIKGGVLDSEVRDDAKLEFIKQIDSILDEVRSLEELKMAFTEPQKEYLNKKLKIEDPIAFSRINKRYKMLLEGYQEMDGD